MKSIFSSTVRFSIGLVAIFCCAGTSLAQETKIASIFTDHMVLQRELPVVIWGSGKSGDTITVKFAGQEMSAPVDKDGRWQVTLKPLEASAEPRELTVHSANGQADVKLSDVLVGEVWIASGQSNMELPLKNTKNSLPNDDHSLRLFHVNRNASPTPVSDVDGKWEDSVTGDAGSFSAVGFYFGRDLRKALNVPVGVIESSWGGTPGRAWTPRDMLLTVPSMKVQIADLDNAIATYNPAEVEKNYQASVAKVKAAIEKATAEGKPAPRIPPKPLAPGHVPHNPSALYNGMIAPLVPLTLRGVIWYQGEADRKAASDYRILFPTLIKSWRQQFGRELTFLFVQIAPHKEMTPEIRDAQLFTWRTVPQTSMVVITDHGSADNIHPKEKEPVGARLSLAARAMAYGEKIEYSGPLFNKAVFKDGQAILSFQHIGAGLVAKDGPLRGFEISGTDGKFVPATATIDGDKIVVKSEHVAAPQAVRFGWTNVPDVNLFNQEGLPATPFRTDSDE